MTCSPAAAPEGRHISQDSIKTIAEGRVWDGATAQQIGLVDRLGSLHTAITGMAADLGLKSYQVATYPKTDSQWWEELLEMEDLAEVSGIDSRLSNCTATSIRSKCSACAVTHGNHRNKINRNYPFKTNPR